ncbi:MAG: sugar phosphate nucleotidyltransferase [Thermoflexaceae bacterium]|nr:sugar phosphate nucleotidyltransferase [Thermoflexaceae bacterium]
MKKTTLVIMAAGIGSRFGGGIKQLEPVGPNGEIIMDYSIYDAMEAGFDKVVFVIRKDLEEVFREVIGNRIEKVVPVEYAFQEIDDLPKGFTVPEGRTKPWGTGQAILACKELINEPFAVINADDYYGKDSFKTLHDYLVEENHFEGQYNISMVGFILKNTLSDNGAVTRGICRADEEGNLIAVDETSGIIKTADGAACERNGELVKIDVESRVSMNMWGFEPDFFNELENGFAAFLSNLKEGGKQEYLLPTIVDGLVKNNKARVKVLESKDKWVGVTYKEDKPVVVASIKELIASGKYPDKLY